MKNTEIRMPYDNFVTLNDNIKEKEQTIKKLNEQITGLMDKNLCIVKFKTIEYYNVINNSYGFDKSFVFYKDNYYDSDKIMSIDDVDNIQSSYIQNELIAVEEYKNLSEYCRKLEEDIRLLRAENINLKNNLFFRLFSKFKKMFNNNC